MSDCMRSKAMIEEYYKELNALNIETTMGFFTEDSVYEDSTLQETFKGKKEIQIFLKEFFDALPSKYNIETLVVTGDGFAVGWRLEGKHIGDLPNMPRTNKSYIIRGSSIGRILNNKILNIVDYWNSGTLLGQLGLVPGSGK